MTPSNVFRSVTRFDNPAFFAMFCAFAFLPARRDWLVMGTVPPDTEPGGYPGPSPDPAPDPDPVLPPGPGSPGPDPGFPDSPFEPQPLTV
jgi:hypothetical protein